MTIPRTLVVVATGCGESGVAEVHSEPRDQLLGQNLSRMERRWSHVLGKTGEVNIVNDFQSLKAFWTNQTNTIDVFGAWRVMSCFGISVLCVF